MADRNGESRKWLTINTAIFGGASITLAILGITKMIASFVSGHVAMPLVGAVLGLGLFGWFGAKNFMEAWKAHSNTDYGQAMTKGITAWAATVGLVLARILI